MTEAQRIQIEQAVRLFKARRDTYRYKQGAAARAEQEEADALRELENARLQYVAACKGLIVE